MEQIQTPNYEKQATYAERKTQLKKAMKSGFYFEAIFLEYAIMEDRTESVLRHAGGIKLVNSRNQPLKLFEKITRIRSGKPFAEKFVRQRLTLELLDRVDEWRVRRNNLVHYLMNSPTAPDELQTVAEEGYEIIKVLDNKVKSVNRYFDNALGTNQKQAVFE